jgi:hypothetical protein
MKINSILYSALGALGGVFICALLGVNFSKGINSTDFQQESPSSEIQPSQGLSDKTLQNATVQANLQRLQSQLNFCQSDLQLVKSDAFQKQIDNRR